MRLRRNTRYRPNHIVRKVLTDFVDALYPSATWGVQANPVESFRVSYPGRK